MRLLLVLLAVTVLVAACGGSEDDTPTDAFPRSESATSAPTDVSTADPGPPPADDDEGDVDEGDAGADDGAGTDGAGAADDGAADEAAGGGGSGGSGDGESGERELTDDDRADIIGDVGEDPVTGGDAADGVALLTDVRVGEHEGFDRIVLEFAGDAVPSYRVAFVDPPITAAGSGNEVEIDGETFLRIHLSGASGVDLSGDQFVETYTGPQRVDGDGTSTVTEVVRTGDFEAELTWVAGLSQQMPFAVATLSDPARLVVDVEVL